MHQNYNGAPAAGSAWLHSGSVGNHVVRGGSWCRDPGLIRSASRASLDADNRGRNDQGFRVARTLTL
jgi:formylglycine-generating enzyme required for sulfatase activity